MTATPAWRTPPDWDVVATESFGPFVVRQLVRRPDGQVVELTARRHRKRLRPRVAGEVPGLRPRAVLWAPRVLGWWVGVLFMVGSACFALGPLPGYESAVSSGAVGVTFFVGSIFFTGASYLQYHQAAGAPDPAPASDAPGRFHPVRARSLGWWSAAVQLVGTVFFNITTYEGMQTGFSVHQSDVRVWSPDFLGSICFLVASWFACVEVRHPRRSLRASWRQVDWRIAWLNMWGSIFFMASAVGAWVRPSTGDVVSLAVDNAGTLLGAVCFLLGAWLLLVELSDGSDPVTVRAAGTAATGRRNGPAGRRRGVAGGGPR